MLLQTNSYVVSKDKRSEHARLLRHFRQTLARLGCDAFEVYEQVGNNWTGQAVGRFIQIMRFRDRAHQLAVQQAEQADPTAQQQIAEFCELVNIPYQQQQGLFAVGYYMAVLPVAPPRQREAEERFSAHPADAMEPVESPTFQESSAAVPAETFVLSPVPAPVPASPSTTEEIIDMVIEPVPPKVPVLADAAPASDWSLEEFAEELNAPVERTVEISPANKNGETRDAEG